MNINLNNVAPKDVADAHYADTANPHATTKSQVGLSNVDNTSDANKPVSTATQTALDLKEATANKQNSLAVDGTGTKFPTVDAVNGGLALKQDKLFIYKETTPSAPVTGTTTETQIYSVTIPANSFAAGDKLVIDNAIVSKTGTAGFAVVRIKLSTSPTMPAGGTDRIADPQTAANANLYFGFSRAFNINGGNIVGINNSQGNLLNDSASNAIIQTKAFNPAITNYLYFSVILGNIGDSVTMHGFTLKNF